MPAKKREPLVLDAPAEVTERARQRLLTAMGRATARYPGQASDPVVANFVDAIGALPNLEPARGIVHELKIPLLDAYRMEGHHIPREVWAELGVEQFYQPPTGRTA